MKSKCILAGALAITLVLPLSAGELPLEVRTLTLQRDTKIKQIDEVYKAELIKLQRKYMKAEDLESAKAVDDIIKSLNLSSADATSKLPTTTQELTEYLPGTSWGPSGRNPAEGLIFSADGTFKWENKTYKYKVTGPKAIILIWGGNTSINCKLAEDFSSFTETEGIKATWNALGHVEQ